MSSRPLVLLLALPVVGVLALGSAVAATSGDDTLVGGGLVGAPTDVPGETGSCADLLAQYVDRGVDEVGPWGWAGAWGSGRPGELERGDAAVSDALPAPLASAGELGGAGGEGGAGTVRQTNEASGTNVQESGVDEADSVKTDGSVLFRVDGTDLTALDVTGTEVRRLGSVDLPRMRDAEILLAGSTVVAVAPDDEGTGTRTAVVDVSDPSAPRVTRTATYDAALVSARQHGTGDDATVRLVLQAGLPDLAFVAPDEGGLGLWRTSEDAAERANEDVVRSSDLDDWLPHVTVDGGDPQRLLDCDEVRVPDGEAGLGTVAIVGSTASDPATTSTTGLVVDTGIAYESADRLYLASSAATAGWTECLDVCPRTTGAWPDYGTTHLHALALTGPDATYVASGEVDGTVRDRWSIDEHDGVVRLAVGPSSETDDANAVVTLAEDGDDLVELGRLDGIGAGEQITSVRWSDGLAIVVTFRQTDPLHLVDLTDPADPTLLGELEVPGFSSYLHPLGGDRMIGLGEGPGRGGWGAQLGLFDVTDLTHPRRVALVHYGPDTWAAAAVDPRQLTWLPDARTVLTVIGDWSTSGSESGYVSVVRLDGAATTQELVEVAHGDEVSDVRLVPLPDGRIVLSTGDDASFLAL